MRNIATNNKVDCQRSLCVPARRRRKYNRGAGMHEHAELVINLCDLLQPDDANRGQPCEPRAEMMRHYGGQALGSNA